MSSCRQDGPARRRRTRLPASERPRRVGILGSFEWHVKQESLRRFLVAADSRLLRRRDRIARGRQHADRRSAPSWSTTSAATTLLGWVDDSAEFLGQCRIGVVSESLGGGFKLKALDYVFNSVDTGLPHPQHGRTSARCRRERRHRRHRRRTRSRHRRHHRRHRSPRPVRVVGHRSLHGAVLVGCCGPAG